MSDSNQKQGLIKYYIAREVCLCYNKKLLLFALAMLKNFFHVPFHFGVILSSMLYKRIAS